MCGWRKGLPAGARPIQITVDTYGHLIPGANRKAVNALDDPGWDMEAAHKAKDIDTNQKIAIIPT